MEVPPEIAFRGVEPTDDLKAHVLDGIAKLESVYPRLISCRTTVEDITPERRSGSDYRVRLEISIPNKTVIVDHHHPEGNERRDVGQTIREAFQIARERVKKAKAVQRGDVKMHELPPEARVVRLLGDADGERYGFLEARDGSQVYFHEDALVDVDYEDLTVGDPVTFTSAEAGDGPRANTVAPLSPPPEVSPKPTQPRRRRSGRRRTPREST